MGVTKNGGYSAGSLETEQRNMSEHDFFKMEWFPRERSRGLLPEKNPLIIFIESAGGGADAPPHWTFQRWRV